LKKLEIDVQWGRVDPKVTSRVELANMGGPNLTKPDIDHQARDGRPQGFSKG
jgi:hypothetical protein